MDGENNSMFLKGLFGGNLMIEIYLFINPLGTECYQAEQKILALVEEKGHKKVQFRFVPFVNMHVVDRFMSRRKMPRHDLNLRNEIFQTLYAAALDYKALQLQGKKKGRQFLLRLQEAVGIKGQTYSTELVEDLVKETGADWEEFCDDRSSNFVKEAFATDQQVAHDMQVCSNPSCVIYNYSCERDFGVLLEGENCKNWAALVELCRTTQDALADYPQSLQHLHLNQQHLHLI